MTANGAYVLIRSSSIYTEAYRTHRKDGSDTRETEGIEGKRRDFSNHAAGCRKRADTRSNADSGMHADIPALHSLLAELVPI
jgi:hypothetical protein